MEFEEMQRIWDKQNQEPLYAVNEAVLHARIKSKGAKVGMMVEFVEWALIISGIVGSVSMLSDTLAEGHHWLAFVCLAVAFAAITNIILLKARRMWGTAKYDQTLLGDLNKAIAQNNYLVDKGKALLWWYVVPVFSAYAVWFIVAGRPIIYPLLMLGLLPLTYIAGRWEMRKWHIPRQHDLEALRELLAQSK